MVEPLALLVDRLQTPIGELLIVADRAGNLRTIDWTDHEARMRQLLDRYYGQKRGKGGYMIDAARDPGGLTRAMRAYFKGDIGVIDKLPVETAGTPFQRSVWRALRKIRGGKTISYAALAGRIGIDPVSPASNLSSGSSEDHLARVKFPQVLHRPIRFVLL